MDKEIRFFKVILVGLLTAAVSLFAQPVRQTSPEPVQTQQSHAADDDQKPQPAVARPNSSELPDAPMPAQPVAQKQSDFSRTQNSGSAPSGAAAAKAAPAKGAPASRPVGAAIAPAKQRGHRSLLIKVGLVAGACVAVGSVVALSKGSSAKPAGAP
jgi:uncharacterized protein involved in copper resistance